MTVIAEIREAVEKKIAAGEWIPRLLQSISEMELRRIMKNLWENIPENALSPLVAAYRLNVSLKIKAKQVERAAYRGEDWMRASQYWDMLDEARHLRNRWFFKRQELREQFMAVDYSNVDWTGGLPSEPPAKQRPPRMKYGKCAKRKMKRAQRGYQYVV